MHEMSNFEDREAFRNDETRIQKTYIFVSCLGVGFLVLVTFKMMIVAIFGKGLDKFDQVFNTPKPHIMKKYKILYNYLFKNIKKIKK